jgi:hypothetical protein
MQIYNMNNHSLESGKMPLNPNAFGMTAGIIGVWQFW